MQGEEVGEIKKTADDLLCSCVSAGGGGWRIKVTNSRDHVLRPLRTLSQKERVGIFSFQSSTTSPPANGEYVRVYARPFLRQLLFRAPRLRAAVEGGVRSARGEDRIRELFSPRNAEKSAGKRQRDLYRFMNRTVEMMFPQPLVLLVRSMFTGIMVKLSTWYYFNISTCRVLFSTRFQ